MVADGDAVSPDNSPSTSTARRGTEWQRQIPNALTILRLVAAVLLFVLIANRQWFAALGVFAVACLTDWLDGYLARLFNAGSAFGRAFDPLVDKVLILGAYVFLMDLRDTRLVGDAGWPAWMMATLLTRELLVTGMRAFIEEQGQAFGADLLGKIKMTAQCASIGWILLAIGLAESGLWFDAFMADIRDVLNLAVVAATVVSGVHYFWSARRAIRI